MILGVVSDYYLFSESLASCLFYVPSVCVLFYKTSTLIELLYVSVQTPTWFKSYIPMAYEIVVVLYKLDAWLFLFFWN